MNNDSMKKQPWILGIDLGVASIGWSKIPLDPSDITTENIDGGVELFDSGKHQCQTASVSVWKDE